MSLFAVSSYAAYPRGRNIFTDFALIATIVGNPSFIHDAVGAQRFSSRIEAVGSESCIFSDENHYFWKKEGLVSDSYERNWQRLGSANLCQTFAQLGYLGDTAQLREGSEMYIQNAKVVLKYWMTHAPLILAYWEGTIELDDSRDVFIR